MTIFEVEIVEDRLVTEKYTLRIPATTAEEAIIIAEDYDNLDTELYDQLQNDYENSVILLKEKSVNKTGKIIRKTYE